MRELRGLLDGRTTPRFVWTATLAGLSIMLAFFVAIGWDFYRGTLSSTEQQAMNVATLVEQAVARDIELYDLSLHAVRDGIRDPELMAQSARLRHVALFDRSTTAHGLGALVVLDQDGTIVANSLSMEPRAGNFADREYFRAHKDAAADIGLYISRPFRARLQGNIWSISLSRRVTREDGSFGGIISGTVKLAYFRDNFEAVNLGARSTITLLRDDGIMLTQNTADDSRTGANWRTAGVFEHLAVQSTGTFWSARSMDGTPRGYAYRRVGTLPLVVSVGVAQAEVLGPFWQKAAILAAVFAFMAVSVVMLVMMFVRELSHRVRSEKTQAALARQDALTGLANRLGFEEALSAAWRRGARTGEPVSLLMIDMDYFKLLNDSLGHLEGDRILVEVARILTGSVSRPFDIAARYGGEELAVLLPHTPMQGALAIGRLVRHAVETLAIPHPGSPHRVVTVSVGAAMVRPDEKDAATLIMLADSALYAAKRNGRNRVECVEVAAAATTAQVSRLESAPSIR